MAEDKEPLESNPDERTKQGRPAMTRRDFLIRGNAGAVAVGVISGAGFAANLVAEPQTRPAPRPAAPAAPAATPLKSRTVTLDIDGKRHAVEVDVRESLWETMNYQLGLSNCNLGCDRAECGACTILVDGLPVNGCAVLTARHGRGQKILTVAGITRGPGVAGLHPLQRAFWFEGGFQCGICTRGMIMSAYALLEKNNNPSVTEIKEALAGNICRCGEYAKILTSVQKAAAEMRGERVTYAAPLIMEEAAASSAPVGPTTSRQFTFVTALGTIEQFDELATELRLRPGIIDVSGSERTITPTWDTRLDEARVRQILAESGHPVAP